MIKSTIYRDVNVYTKFGKLYVNANMEVVSEISNELKEYLLKTKSFYEVTDAVEEVKAEAVEDIVEEVVEVETDVDLSAMTVAELRKFAKEHNVKLSATRKADIIEEILTEM